MLNDVAKIRRVVIACGAVDLRKGIDGLVQIIGARYHWNPFEKRNTISLLWKKVRSYERPFVDGQWIFTPLQKI